MKVNIAVFGQTVNVNAIWLAQNGVLTVIPQDGDELTPEQWCETESPGARQTFKKLTIKLPRKQKSRGSGQQNKRQKINGEHQDESNDTDDEDEVVDPLGAEHQEGIDDEEEKEEEEGGQGQPAVAAGNPRYTFKNPQDVDEARWIGIPEFNTLGPGRPRKVEHSTIEFRFKDKSPWEIFLPVQVNR